MRFFEYESRQILQREGIPVADGGFATDAEQAKAIAADIGGPVVIKSQVLTGGRMKAGGVKFADTPAEAEAHAKDILQLEINGHMPRGVLVDPKAEVEQEYYAGVVWDGIRKQPVIIFSPVGGIDIEQVAEEQPDKVGRRHFSNILPFGDFEAKEVIASTGVTGSALNKLTPILTRLAKLFVAFMATKEAQAVMQHYDSRSSHLVEGTLMNKYLRESKVVLQSPKESIDYYLKGETDEGLQFKAELARILKQ